MKSMVIVQWIIVKCFVNYNNFLPLEDEGITVVDKSDMLVVLTITNCIKYN